MNSLQTATIAICLLFTACGPEAPTGMVSFHHYAPGALAKGMDALADKFNSSQSQLKMAMVPVDHESFKSSIQNSLTKETPPELFTYWAGARTEAIIPHLEPLDELWESQGWNEVFPPSLTESSATYQGHKYLLPMTLQYIGFFYNKKVFSEAGISPPANWNDFLRSCEILKKKGITPLALGAKDRWPAQFWFDYLLLRTAGAPFRDQLIAGKVALDTPEVREVFRQWKELLDRKFFNPQPEMEAWDSFAAMAVMEGTSAMTLNGTWTLGYFQALNPSRTGDIGFFPFPIMADIPKAALGYVEGAVAPRGSMNPGGAREALKFLAGPEAQTHMSLTFGSLSPRTGGLDADVPAIQKEILREVETAPVWATNLDLSLPVPGAEVALNLFREFLRFPEQYRELLSEASPVLTNVLRP